MIAQNFPSLIGNYHERMICMFWQNFKKLCESIGTSPNAVCANIGLSTAAATYWKNGSIPKGDALIKLADYFNVSVDYLLGRDIPDSPIVLSYNGSNPLKQEISSIITDILDSTDDTNKLDLLKNILIGFAK